MLKRTKMTNTFDTKIILHNYILYKGQPSYIIIFQVYLRIPLIFKDFPTGNGFLPSALQEICKYQGHP